MVRTETGDGATLAGCPELRTILDFIHPGETLVVTRIDRLARPPTEDRPASHPASAGQCAENGVRVGFPIAHPACSTGLETPP